MVAMYSKLTFKFLVTTCYKTNKMENKKYHNVGTVSKSNLEKS